MGMGHNADMGNGDEIWFPLTVAPTSTVGVGYSALVAPSFSFIILLYSFIVDMTFGITFLPFSPSTEGLSRNLAKTLELNGDINISIEGQLWERPSDLTPEK